MYDGRMKLLLLLLVVVCLHFDQLEDESVVPLQDEIEKLDEHDRRRHSSRCATVLSSVVYDQRVRCFVTIRHRVFEAAVCLDILDDGKGIKDGLWIDFHVGFHIGCSHGIEDMIKTLLVRHAFARVIMSPYFS